MSVNEFDKENVVNDVILSLNQLDSNIKENND